MPDRREQIIRLIAEAEGEAYARGYNDAIAAMNAAVAAAGPRPQTIPAESSAPISSGETPVTRPRGRPAKIINLVHNMIIAKPGLTGAEIVRALQSQGTPVLDRTMRSCVRRLKNSGEIRQRAKRWYPKSKDKIGIENIGETPVASPH